MMTTNPLTTLIGKTVLNGMTEMTITAFLDKQGTIKSGDRLPYIQLVGGDTELSLHPQHAMSLMKTGKYKELSILSEIAGEQVVLDSSSATNEGEAEVEVEVEAAPVEVEAAPVEVEAAPVEVEAAPVEPTPAKEKKVNKRQQTEELYIEGHKQGLTRKAIITQMKAQLGMSDAGANTYYQNAKTKLG